MKKPNKYFYLWIVQGKYGELHGWEDVCTEETRRDAVLQVRAYNRNETQYPHRLIRRREPNPAYTD